MAKLTKHAEILGQLHSIVTKQAEAQASVVGTPGKDTHPASPDKSTDTIDKNKVKPEDNKNHFTQEPSKEEAGKVVSSKSASVEKLATEILDLLKNHTDKVADAQETVTGTPAGSTDPSSPEKSTETVNKNDVKPEDNTNEIKQTGSPEEAGKSVSDSSVKGETKVEEKKIETAKVEEKAASAPAKVDEMGAKIAAYNAGANIIRDLLKQSSYAPLASEKDLLKQAGARDFELLINEAAAELQKSSSTKVAPKNDEAIKHAEAAGAAYFDEIFGAATEKVAAEKSTELEEKIAALSTELAGIKAAEAKKETEKSAAEKENELATKIAGIVLAQLEAKLKGESAGK